MKKIIVAALFLSGLSSVFGQEEHDRALETWYHNDFAKTNVYGINTENAYKFLESKGLKPRTVVVGVLDSGVQVDHPGLVNNIWTNPNEVPNNGIDDDHNGHIDDIHGWNFIGGKNGNVGTDNLEVTRVVRKYKPVFEGTDAAQNKANQSKMPEEFEMYMKSKKKFEEGKIEAEQNYQHYKAFKEKIPGIIAMMGGKPLDTKYLETIKPKNKEEAVYLTTLIMMAESDGIKVKGKTPEEIKSMLSKEVDSALKYFEPQVKYQYNLDFDSRESVVGDNYDDYNESNYGNNDYEGLNAEHGTHVAGIIAGLPQGNEIQYGVADKVAKIMVVRAVPDGDERDKDVANAIRYAVDNGAKILNMSFGKPVSPGKKYVWDAIKYAQDKGVLLVKAAGNDNENIEENVYYPTNFKSPKDVKPFVNNMIVVGASTNDNEDLKASFSNYNQKMVNVFAPGTKIYSTVPTSKYEYLQGTSMASPVVAGAAAVLKAYMPELTPAQIIEALEKSVNKSAVSANEKDVPTLTFDKLSVAGGVIDLEKAAEYAYSHFYAKNNKVEKVKKRLKRRAFRRH